MPQLHIYVPELLVAHIRQEASAACMSVSQYLAEVVKRELQPEWPAGSFEEVVGGWQGGPLLRDEERRLPTPLVTHRMHRRATRPPGHECASRRRVCRSACPGYAPGEAR